MLSRHYNTLPGSIIVVTTLRGERLRGTRKIEGKILGREMKINIKCLSLEMCGYRCNIRLENMLCNSTLD